MIVCIAEKPSVGRSIAQVLGANKSCDGYYEGNGYQVTWVLGHLCTLKEPEDYSPLWKKWELAFLPMIPEPFGIKVIDDKGVKHQFGVIEKLVQQADEVINCGDAGQEGELIQRWVMQKAKVKCPVKRLWISSLTEESIRDGFQNLQDQDHYQSLYEAGLCRAIGDWLLGMNCTRLYTVKYSQMRGQTLSIGRVQTPTLAMIVNRQLEIQNFTPEQYWVLSTIYRNVTFTLQLSQKEEEEDSGGKNSRNRITSLEEGQKAMETIRGKEFEVVGISKKNGTESAPKLYDLTSLQVDCNKKFSFSADTTLKIIQSLYEKKITTYPRVDTTYLTDDIYPKCPTILKGLTPYAPLVQPLLGGKLPKSKKVFDNSKVTDHHAIIPTGENPQNASLSREEKLVFDLVARHFIAVFYPECKVATTTVQGKVEEMDFKATGKQILDLGWRVVFDSVRKASEEEDDKKDEEKVLPDFQKGEKGPHEPTLTEKWTTPPKPFTEATLLRAMETAGKLVEDDELRDALKANGIGRPSTRAAIIETLFRRNYVRKEKKNLVATQTGIDLIAIIREELLKSAELTGRWEKKLRDIEAHNYDSRTFMEELKQMVAQLVWEVKNDNSNRRVAVVQETAKAPKGKTAKNTSDGEKKPRKPRKPKLVKEGDTCPLCKKGTVIRGKTALGCSEWKSGCSFRQPLETEKKD